MLVEIEGLVLAESDMLFIANIIQSKLKNSYFVRNLESVAQNGELIIYG